MLSHVFIPLCMLCMLCLLSGVPSSRKAFLETLNMTCSEEIAQEYEDTWSRLSFAHLKILHLFINLCTFIYMCVPQYRCGSQKTTCRNQLFAAAVWNSMAELRSVLLGSKRLYRWIICPLTYSFFLLYVNNMASNFLVYLLQVVPISFIHLFLMCIIQLCYNSLFWCQFLAKLEATW